MPTRPILILVLIGLVCVGTPATAALSVKVDEPKTTGKKTIVKIALKNTFTEKIESARATLFLISDNDKIVGQRTAWIIGGTKDKPPLKPGTTTTYTDTGAAGTAKHYKVRVLP